MTFSNSRLFGLLFAFASTAGCSGNSASEGSDPSENGPGGSGAADEPTLPLAGGLGEIGGASEGGDHEGIQYFGRWDFSNPETPTASWGAVYLTARFSGTSVGIRLTDARNDFQYRIDGGDMIVLSPDAATEYTLAEGLEEGEHTLEFYRRSGGSFGRTAFGGLILDEGAELLEPPGRPLRKLEILGDSISVGYGNEGMNATSRATENGYEAYGPQLARLLDAQWSVIAHSGQGMVRNLGEEKSELEDSDHMPDEFRMTHFPGGGENPDWDFSSYQPDVLLITLGTNDFSWPVWNMDPGPDYELTEEEFVGGYTEFLTFVRSVYPETTVFAVGTFIANDSNQFGRANEYTCQAIAQMDDEKMHCIDPGLGADGLKVLGSGSDYIGDWTHPTVAGHTKIAEALYDVVAPTMGW